MARSRPKTVTAPNDLNPPPRVAFIRLLEDPDNDAELKRLLTRYEEPVTLRRLLYVLQGTRFAHQLGRTVASTTSRHRLWFKRAARFRRRIAKLDPDYEALLIYFRDTLYGLLRADRRLPDDYGRRIAETFDAIAHLQKVVASDPILTIRPTTRGHQAEPHKRDAQKALRKIGITVEDADQFLRLIGVKPDTLV